ncbi:protein of unknown function [Methylocaldum szegediense]|uniref:Uncharacterized protein n=1 Tax=Methylocaldum szegediense TaxID=73780 RepID=A0ABM9I931_9GAMM|nr:protein of unknown function [Methylocaldum szegediense]
MSLAQAVSIHSRLLSRELRRHGEAFYQAASCFNPLPVIKPGVTRVFSRPPVAAHKFQSTPGY